MRVAFDDFQLVTHCATPPQCICAAPAVPFERPALAATSAIINYVITKCWRQCPRCRGGGLKWGDVEIYAMSTKRNTVPQLQRELLMAGIKNPGGRLRFAKCSAETLAATYAALLSLQRKKLIEPEKQADPDIMSWKVTKAGKAVLAEKPDRR
jgi:hypothetical protein